MTAPVAADSRIRPRLGAKVFSRGNLPLVGVLLLLALLLAVSALGNRPAEPLPFDLDSTSDSGLRGLSLWLGDLGYEVRRIGGIQYDLSSGVDLLFVYPNQLSYTPDEAAQLRSWVSSGGTLVLVGPHPEDRALEEEFGVRSLPRAGFGVINKQTQPLVPEGADEYMADWSVEDAVLDLQDAPSAVSLLQSGSGEPVVAVQTIGDGVVWHLAPGSALVNRGLREENQGDLLPPILRRVPEGGVVAFDTFHQFGLIRFGERILTLQDWLYRTSSGWAVLFGVATIGLYLVLQGRRLGPPVVTWAERRRREAAEYVEAMALLTQRAGLGADVAAYQHQRLKRGLARKRPLDPMLPDAVFLDRLAYSEPQLTKEQVVEVAQTLQALQGKPNQQQLTLLAARIDRLLS